MSVTTLKYDRRFNLGDYEYETVELTIELSEGERAQDALNLMRKFTEMNRR